jgi:hypothetical protein
MRDLDGRTMLASTQASPTRNPLRLGQKKETYQVTVEALVGSRSSQ